MATLTDNYAFSLPDNQSDVDSWGNAFDPSDDILNDPSPGYNGNWEKLDLLMQDLISRVETMENNGVGGFLAESFEYTDRTEPPNVNYQIIGDHLSIWGMVDHPSDGNNDPHTHSLPLTYDAPPTVHMTRISMSNGVYAQLRASSDAVDSFTAWVVFDHGSEIGGDMMYTAMGIWDGVLP